MLMLPTATIQQKGTVVHLLWCNSSCCLQMRAAELGMSSRQMLQTYAREASTLLLAEVERYCIPLEQHSRGQPSSGSSVDPQQLSLNEISGGLRSIQTAPTQQQRPARGRDAAWGWLVPGEQRNSTAAAA
jgi:hypothetical protein